MTSSDTTTVPRSTPDLAAPGTPDYLRAVATFNLAADLRPRAAITATRIADVHSVLARASAAGLRVVPMVTGHSATMLPALDDAVLLRLELDVPLAVDAATQLITIPAGARWGDVIALAAEHGLAVPHGSSPDIGAVGYLLGGGLSFYGRRTGVAANSVVAITLVVADGTELTVDADNDRELFWALRGGGGGFGIVTRIVIRGFAMHGVVTGMTAWAAKEARGIAHLWRTWAKDAPRSVTTALRLLRLPDIPETPEVLRGRQVLVLDGAIDVPQMADAEAAYEQLVTLLAPMRSIREPLLETWHLGPVADLPATHADPRTPLPYVTDCLTIGDLTEDALDAWWDWAGPSSGSTLTSAELRQLGGAFSEPAPDGGAFSSIRGDALLFALGVVAGEGAEAGLRTHLNRLRMALTPYSTPFTAPTLVEEPTSPRRTFDADVEARVEAVRTRVDPEGVFELDTRRSRP